MSVPGSEERYLVAHPMDCGRYYSCQADGEGGWIAHLMDCPHTTGFDTELGICNHVSLVPRCQTG